MKNIYTALFLFLSNYCVGQGFQLQLKAGCGITNTTGKINYDNLDIVWSKPVAPLFTKNAALLGSYLRNRWTISIGIGYLESGFKEHYEYREFWNIEVEDTKRFYHIMLPVAVAYKMSIRQRFYFNPSLGAAVSHNYAIKETDKENDRNNVFHTTTGNMPDLLFNFNFERTTIWGTLGATFGYALNNRVDITLGPEIAYMITAAEKRGSPYSDQHQNMRNYAVTMNAGIAWRLKDGKRK